MLAGNWLIKLDWLILKFCGRNVSKGSIALDFSWRISSFEKLNCLNKQKEQVSNSNPSHEVNIIQKKSVNVWA